LYNASMNLVLKWYYGYKNFGDEILLLWVLFYCVQEAPDITCIFIESQDVDWLQMRINKNKNILESLWVSAGIHIQIVRRIPIFPSPQTLLVIWGWEALTDARLFPYNGWSTFVYCLRYIMFSRVWVLWGIWTINRMGTKLLYTLFLWKVERIVCRERWSHQIASQYSNHSLLYRDFAYSVVDVVSIKETTKYKTPYIIINLNQHIYSEENLYKVIETISPFVQTHDVWFFPASVWNDDSDVKIYKDFVQYIPTIKLFMWTEYSLEEIFWFVSHASYALATRLHIILLLQHYWVPFDYLVYQEKIQKFFDGKVK
jgi:polysaccharide pyruvyl transferase WcaK-like protein